MLHLLQTVWMLALPLRQLVAHLVLRWAVMAKQRWLRARARMWVLVPPPLMPHLSSRTASSQWICSCHRTTMHPFLPMILTPIRPMAKQLSFHRVTMRLQLVLTTQELAAGVSTATMAALVILQLKQLFVPQMARYR